MSLCFYTIFHLFALKNTYIHERVTFSMITKNEVFLPFSHVISAYVINRKYMIQENRMVNLYPFKQNFQLLSR